ncbi:MAG: phosphatidylserine decarboxylase family protein [Acidobacteria bacterium]|nr:phosphatidylserine decarboxylase family protein [Acidobacteriota bacterium]
MIRDGFLYAIALGFLGAFAAAVAGPAWAIPGLLLAAFVLYFFRDPERTVPDEEAIVSPADGRVVDLRQVELDGRNVWRISIFLSLFNVHVNRSPIAGVIRNVCYTPGKFFIASRPEASAENEQNTVTVEGKHFTVTFKQIAGTLARRIVFWKKPGDQVACGERVGLIKFGSRVDLFLPIEIPPSVAVGDRVKGGVSILARPGNRFAGDAKPASADKGVAGG